MILDPDIVARCIETLWVLWAIYWFVNAFGNKRAVYRQSPRSRLFYLALLIAAVIIVKHIPMSQTPLFRETIYTQLLGIALCASGLALAIWARRILGANWSGLITLKENHELIRAGPYRFVRHPIYSGIILAVAGSVIVCAPVAHGIVLFAIIAIALKLKSLGEEKILIPQFPDTYPQYKKDVKSLVPFVW